MHGPLAGSSSLNSSGSCKSLMIFIINQSVSLCRIDNGSASRLSLSDPQAVIVSTDTADAVGELSEASGCRGLR